MTGTTGQSRILLWTILFISLCTATLNAVIDSAGIDRIRAASRLRLEHPERSIQEFRSLHNDFIERKDTVLAIRALTSLATVYGNMANYRGSYNCLWKALLLADQANLDAIKVYVYQRIGRYYAFYKRREKALHFIEKGLSLNKSLVESGEMHEATLTQRYLAISATYLEFKEVQLAQTYLDSCFLYYKEGIPGSLKLPFLTIRQAFIDVEMNKSEEAIQSLETWIPWVQANLPSYLVLVNSYLGDAYLKVGMDAKSEKCYLDALTVSDELNSHLDFSILIHEKLAHLYFRQKKFREAFRKLERVQLLDKRFFDSRSEYNHSLLEIQDQFRSAMEAKEELLKEKRITELEHENHTRFLRNVIFSVLSGTLVLFGILFFYYLRNKHRMEKRLIELEIKTSKELLELKNKELAASALKLVEKDEFLKELEGRVAGAKNSISAQEIKHLIKTATNGNTNSWKLFESQFVAVNNGFFEDLRKNFPDLTQGDKRLCALIKLKLNSKEIAGLMGISVESVHKSRYRLRKKLQIEKGKDLADFMNEFNHK